MGAVPLCSSTWRLLFISVNNREWLKIGLQSLDFRKGADSGDYQITSVHRQLLLQSIANEWFRYSLHSLTRKGSGCGLPTQKRLIMRKCQFFKRKSKSLQRKIGVPYKQKIRITLFPRAHRFAHRYTRSLRGKNTLIWRIKSIVDSVPWFQAPLSNVGTSKG